MFVLVLSDGSIKSQEAHSSLFQSGDVWFTACNPSSIIDNPSLRSEDALVFEICQADDRDDYKERRLVYDTINDYFKIIISVEQLKEVCRIDGDRCHLLPMKAKVIDLDELHIVIEPSSKNTSFVLSVGRVKGNAPYGKVNMAKRSSSRRGQTIMKIVLE